MNNLTGCLNLDDIISRQFLLTSANKFKYFKQQSLNLAIISMFYKLYLLEYGTFKLNTAVEAFKELDRSTDTVIVKWNNYACEG